MKFLLSFLLLAGLAVAEPPLLIAHRGVVTETSPENSLAALEGAIAAGYTHVEVDLRPTKEGTAICLHDRSLRRTFEVAAHADELTLEAIHEKVSPELAPSFETFCARAAGRIKLMPDVKECPPELVDAFRESIRASLDKHGLMPTALFIGVDEIIAPFADSARVKWRDHLAEAKVSPRWAESPERYFIFNHAADFTAEEVAGFQAHGLPVIVSINTLHYLRGEPIPDGLADVERMLALGVDGLQIDHEYAPAVPREFWRTGAGGR